MGYSDKCADREKRWDALTSKCVPCPLKPGHKVTPNCGYDDYGGRHEVPLKPCDPNTFNDGNRPDCKPCSPCPTGYKSEFQCSSTTDTKCAKIRVVGTEVPEKFQTHPTTTSSPTALTTSAVLGSAITGDVVSWAVPLAILIVIMLVLLPVWVLHMKRQKRGQNTILGFRRKSSYINAGFSSMSATPANSDPEDAPSPDVLSAPLQTVLDDLDVLEELVILLDPESHGVKNTKHLASLVSFPNTWITYTYSMRDSKSPLKAVLEGVTSRHPDWTVGHLAKLLQQIERNDAVAVLSKIRLSEMAV
ncbi:IGF-like family receptor 1 isoform X2 [Halichoeres trimaculatus]|uniref:IGF-like family receptor 1 isoform X2 n=1 Tax=Halichoeres trimaculatus TaxID=147232 RepID=UPI003D9EC59A